MCVVMQACHHHLYSCRCRLCSGMQRDACLPCTESAHAHARTHTHRTFSFRPMADGTARTTIKYGFTSCFRRQAANYLKAPAAVCREVPPRANIHLTSIGLPACPLPSSLVTALLSVVSVEECACIVYDPLRLFAPQKHLLLGKKTAKRSEQGKHGSW